MKDTYADYAELARHEQVGKDYSIHLRFQSARVGVFAIHGGGIEVGTSELALAIAGKDWSYYLFSGDKTNDNHRLHLTSTRFDEPLARQLAGQCERIIALHGATGKEERVYVGGLDNEWRQRIKESLAKRGFVAADPPLHLGGKEPENIVNRGRRKKGVQLELTTALRHAFFQGKGRTARMHPTPRFHAFVEAVRVAIADDQA
ncbi:poly-gamma-glutamate hydrolase family protein [Laceyella putida]|uniref:Poly-gamma-glutamate hydrolase family protein n=1 Tax=Laceyella putida TaxID=110101 RepID=A0ABW2RGT1_9BACL